MSSRHCVACLFCGFFRTVFPDIYFSPINPPVDWHPMFGNLRWANSPLNWCGKILWSSWGIYIFSCFICVPVNPKPTSGKKTGKQQGCRRGLKNKAETPHLPRRAFCFKRVRTEPLPALLRSLSASAHLLLITAVRGHLLRDPWWQWIASLLGPQEAVWSFDEAFAFTFSAKAWWPAVGSVKLCRNIIQDSTANEVLTLLLIAGWHLQPLIQQKEECLNLSVSRSMDPPMM